MLTNPGAWVWGGKTKFAQAGSFKAFPTDTAG